MSCIRPSANGGRSTLRGMSRGVIGGELFCSACVSVGGTIITSYTTVKDEQVRISTTTPPLKWCNYFSLEGVLSETLEPETSFERRVHEMHPLTCKTRQGKAIALNKIGHLQPDVTYVPVASIEFLQDSPVVIIDFLQDSPVVPEDFLQDN